MNLRLSIAKAALDLQATWKQQCLKPSRCYMSVLDIPFTSYSPALSGKTEDWIWLQFEIHTHMFVVLSGLQVNVLLWSCVTIKCS